MKKHPAWEKSVSIYLSQLTPIAGKQNLKGLRNCSEEWQFYGLFYTLESKEETKEGCMTPSLPLVVD